MPISEDRLKHCLGVAKKMEMLVETNDNYKCLNPKEMFTLGLLHDIGYEFSDNAGHNVAGGLLLKAQGYKYWKEVYYHGVPQTEYLSEALMLLNHADVTVGPTGLSVTVEERIEDIGHRYGKDSKQYKDCVKLVSMIFNGSYPHAD